jgi:hypothetical protein
MNKLFRTFPLLAAIAFFASACLPAVVDVARAAPSGASYESLLGKPVSDPAVADFMISNDCTQSGLFQLCRPAGISLSTDANQVVKTVHFHVESADGFAAYEGVLPLGLASDDTMASVEQKMGHSRVEHAPQAGWVPGLPDEGSSPDHIHYWAIYKRFGLTVIYNSPSPNDKGATIHAIRLHK